MAQVSIDQRRGMTAAMLRFGLGAIGGAMLGVFLLALASGLVRAAAPGALGAADMGRGGLFFRGEGPGAFVAAPPDLATEVHVAVGGMLARVTVIQHFRNPSDEWQEGVYVFPLPETAAVDRVRLRVGARTIVGEIRERRKARQVYERARAAGVRATLVEQERPNVFTASVANIGPGEIVTVEIGYQQTVRYDAGAFRLRIPLVVAPRYEAGPRAPGIAGVAAAPPAGPVAAPLRQAGEGTANPVQMLIRLDPGFAVERIESPYHAIKTRGSLAEGYTIVLDGDAVPADRDFELVWRPPPTAAPLAALFAEERGERAYVLMMVTPPEMEPEAAPRALRREVVFVIDTSGSMAGQSLDQAKLALGMALARLDEADRFNLIRFNDSAAALFPAARPATPAAVRLAMAAAALGADGGTEMRPAFLLALDGRRDPGRIRQVVFLTDGDVANEEDLFRLIAARLGDSRLFTIGIGSAPNGYFMRQAARLGRGTFTYIGAVDEVRARMAALFAKLERPALTDLALDLPEGTAAELLPRRLPDLYYAEPLVVALRLGRLAGTVTVSGRLGGRRWQAQLALSEARAVAGVAKVWGRRKLRALADGARRGADMEAVRRAMTRLAVEHGLMSPYTSLVAVETTPARPAAAPLTRRDVPLNRPRGWARGEAAGPAPAPFGGGALPVVFALPRTATPAALEALLGALALMLAGLTWWLARRRA